MRTFCLIILAFLVSACDGVFPGPDEKFGRQNFVSAISLIELHNVRNGEYPKSLDDLQYLGDWDGIWLNAVRYEPVEGGYNLYVERGWMGEPDLTFPEDFRKGLGLKATNVQWKSN